MSEKQTATLVDPTKLVTGVTKPDSSAVLNVDEAIGGGTDTVVSSGQWGFPKAKGQSLSYWLQQVRCDELISHRTTAELPETADTVIIGSGITGTLVAKYHKETWPDKMEGVGKYEKQFGIEQAMKILQNEQDTWEALVAYIREKNVDCDLWVGDTLDVPLDAETAALARDVFERYRAAGGKVDHIKVTTDPAAARRLTRLADARACYAWPASTLQPRKLAAHVMGVNLAAGVNLQTFTPARGVRPYGDADSSTEGTEEKRDAKYRWTVHTDRGTIACVDVVHASNAYLPAYETSLRGLIRPKPHMCNKVIPPLKFAGSGALRNSYGVLLRDGSLFSINPRYGTDGVVMIGGSNPGQLKLDEWVAAQPAEDQRCVDDGLSSVGVAGDSSSEAGAAAARLVTDEVRKFAEAQFDGWRESADRDGLGPGARYEYSWSGIIGVAADGVPFVGEMPGRAGQWVCAGHCGHGMARIFTAAPGLVKLMAASTPE
ncbi:FAD dependent oxidoreductase [Apiospora rasikravindrae]|uniref:FAD dependent oxidoreductase n=1 Tax=Apiospora rasikravindrae TaxID=990691 RepID=A0ABR1S2D1_9PEZI